MCQEILVLVWITELGKIYLNYLCFLSIIYLKGIAKKLNHIQFIIMIFKKLNLVMHKLFQEA